MERLIDLLSQQSKVALDTNILIYHFEQNQQFGVAATAVMKAIEDGLPAVCSILTVMELLVAPRRLARVDLYDLYRQSLLNFPNLQIVDVDISIAERAATLRAAYPSLRAIDAVNIAAGLHHNATLYLTNDQRNRQVAEIEVCCLSDFVT